MSLHRLSLLPDCFAVPPPTLPIDVDKQIRVVTVSYICVVQPVAEQQQLWFEDTLPAWCCLAAAVVLPRLLTGLLHAVERGSLDARPTSGREMIDSPEGVARQMTVAEWPDQVPLTDQGSLDARPT